MAKQFRGYRSGLDSDIEAILKRIYDSPSSSDTRSPSTGIPKAFHPSTHESNALKEALARLRSLREKSQSTREMKEEIAFLREQIEALKALREEIESLSQQLPTQSAEPG